MATKEQTLDLLWNMTSTYLIDKIKAGNATPNDISNAIKFLKEGIIDELREADNPEAKEAIVGVLAKLPFDSDEYDTPQ
jgi:hypothetical protein